MADYYFEDFYAGQTFESETDTLSETDIVEFGRRYAPMPYHTDPEAAKDTIYGGVIAAGYQTAAVTFGLFARTGVLLACGMGSPGVDQLRWHRPVRPGDVLRMVAEIVEVSPAKEAGGRDAIRIRYDTFNQDDELVMTLTSLHFVKRRPADHG